MKAIRKILCLCSFLMCCCLTSCNKKNTDFTVGICQLVQHEALDSATQGFVDALQAKMDAEGKTITFDLQNASGEQATCSTIVNKFVSNKYDLIMANATAALQAADQATNTIPVLGTSITDYGVALGIENFTGLVGGNVSGTSDLANLEDQAKMIKEFVPEAQKVGILYCSAEANSKYQSDQVKMFLEGDGLEVTVATFSESNDLSSVLTNLCSKVDCIYVPTDNTCASNAANIDNICRQKRIPVIAGEENLCKLCGVGTISISYYGIGQKAGEMAAEILLNGADISTMAIQYDQNPIKKYNREICEDLGIVPPEGYIAIEG